MSVLVAYFSVGGRTEKVAKKVAELTEEAVSLMHHLTGENRFLENLLVSLISRNR